MKLEEFKKKAKKLPDGPGVYFFLAKNRKVLYIGKATSLRDRVRSYFVSDIASVRSPLIAGMVAKAASIDWRATDSVLEALLLEASLVRSHKPPHNTDLKDDKSFNYVVFTKEDFPRVVVVRGKNITQDFPPETRMHCFGPFPHGMQLREAMKIIRRIFPFRDTCTPAQEMLTVGKKVRPCFNRQIGLCPGVCSGDMEKAEYRRTIRHLALFFSGKKSQLTKLLQKEMKAAAKEEHFEEASRLRKQIFALGHIQDVSLIKEEYRAPGGTSNRIEAYDMAHLRGSANVGVMTVVEDGMPHKNEYRKFRIRTASPGDDVGALKEVLTRRLGHDEWPLPRIIVVDGSTAQMNGATKVLQQYGIQIPIVGVVKDEKHRPRSIQGDRSVIEGKEKDILLANAEAHRFAISYHRRTRRIV